jgi:hypothetical protein
MTQTIKQRINAKIEAIKQKSVMFKNEVIQTKDTIKYAEMENNKLMIALGYYSSVLKELIKRGYENVGDLDLIAEHFDTHQTVNNIFNFSKSTISNLMSPTETVQKRLETYNKLEKLYMFCIDNEIKEIQIKIRNGLFKKKENLDINEEIKSIIKLKKECVV